MQIEIHIPRPFLTLSILGIAGYIVWSQVALHEQKIMQETAEGGPGTVQAQVIHQAEQNVSRVREEQAVLSRREEILRAQLDSLEEEQRINPDENVQRELAATRARLIALIQDQQAAEQEILASLRQIWEAQGYAIMASRQPHGSEDITFIWPMEPDLGISAHFDDEGYERRFGMPHQAIDIPATQGSPVMAAADGIVVKAVDNGLGFNSVVIRHAGGFATLYGHVSEFFVREGDRVYAGDIIALSGGTPGTKGAGHMTTGAHLHLQFLKDGIAVDPLTYLPSYRP